MIKYLGQWVSDYVTKYNRKILVLTPRITNQDLFLVEICKKALERLSESKIHIITNDNRIKDIYPNFEIEPDSRDDLYVSAAYYANKTDGLVISSITKTFGSYYRNYSKIRLGCEDIFPLLDLNQSNIYEVVKTLDSIKEYCYVPEKDIEIIEWCNYIEEKYGVITDEKPPHKHQRWPYFTAEQKKWVAFIHQREKKTRHKIIKGPFPTISDKSFLIC